MDPDLIATALEYARRLDDAADTRPVLAAPDPSPPPTVQAIGYDHPTRPDAQGFVAIGELHDPARTRTGMVLLHQATGSVRLTWTTDAAPRERPRALAPRPRDVAPPPARTDDQSAGRPRRGGAPGQTEPVDPLPVSHTATRDGADG